MGVAAECIGAGCAWGRRADRGNGSVFRAPADRLSRPSPRIAQGAAEVCRLLDEARRLRAMSG
jgi:hypothetical protein